MLTQPPFLPTFGSGTPGASANKTQPYYDNSTNPYTPYIYDPAAAAWKGANAVSSNANLPGNPTTTTQALSDNSTRIATTAFVQGIGAGINPGVGVTAATTAAGDTSGMTYANGAGGIGATLTGPANTAITIDGVLYNALGQSLLVKNDTQSPSGAFNGVYSLTALQTTLTGAVFTRRLDFDQPSDINNTGVIPVAQGTVNTNTGWYNTATVNVVGSDPLIFQQFNKNSVTVVTSAANLTANASLYGGDGVRAIKTAALNSMATNKYLQQVLSGAPSFQQITMTDIADYTSPASSVPSLTFGGGSVGMTTSVASIRWMKTGKLVFFSLQIILSAKGSSTGAAGITLTGLPAAENVNSSNPPLATLASPFTITGTPIAEVSMNTNILTLYAINNGSLSIIDHTYFQNSTEIDIAGCYICA